ncbi:UNKNOWN [Stylonychia lemnae]|uniref:Uncharacterized protein n=1 Tax=Stylonychia lemnae TaxID=5949 RepID=A0A078BD31_STYLE|nr:UNKNOWN [Stylonychia lemnae]|eukprot:CDW91122.1 UNKNOWN [Stylonychia lemnae]
MFNSIQTNFDSFDLYNSHPDSFSYSQDDFTDFSPKNFLQIPCFQPKVGSDLDMWQDRDLFTNNELSIVNESALSYKKKDNDMINYNANLGCLDIDQVYNCELLIREFSQNVLYGSVGEELTVDEQFSASFQVNKSDFKVKIQQKSGQLQQSNGIIKNQSVKSKQQKVKINRKEIASDIAGVDIDLMTKHILRKNSFILSNELGRAKRVQHEQYLEDFQRIDVLLKTITREIRRVYLKEFQEQTRYLKVQQYRDKKYYLVALQKFSEQILSTQKWSYTKNNQEKQDLVKEMSFLLGSMFYPKKMDTLFEDKCSQKLISEINSSLYQFTLKKFDFINGWEAYQILIHHFMEYHSQNSLVINKTMNKQTEVYIRGFDYLKQIHNIEVQTINQ